MQPFFSRFVDVIGLEQVWWLSIKKKSNKVTVLGQISLQNMANANCGGDIDVMIAQLIIILMVNPSHFPDQLLLSTRENTTPLQPAKIFTRDRFFGI